VHRENEFLSVNACSAHHFSLNADLQRLIEPLLCRSCNSITLSCYPDAFLHLASMCNVFHRNHPACQASPTAHLPLPLSLPRAPELPPALPSPHSLTPIPSQSTWRSHLPNLHYYLQSSTRGVSTYPICTITFKAAQNRSSVCRKQTLQKQTPPHRNESSTNHSILSFVLAYALNWLIL
jgi:hypothetical protein